MVELGLLRVVRDGEEGERMEEDLEGEVVVNNLGGERIEKGVSGPCILENHAVQRLVLMNLWIPF